MADPNDPLNETVNYVAGEIAKQAGGRDPSQFVPISRAILGGASEAAVEAASEVASEVAVEVASEVSLEMASEATTTP